MLNDYYSKETTCIVNRNVFRRMHQGRCIEICQAHNAIYFACSEKMRNKQFKKIFCIFDALHFCLVLNATFCVALEFKLFNAEVAFALISVGFRPYSARFRPRF